MNHSLHIVTADPEPLDPDPVRCGPALGVAMLISLLALAALALYTLGWVMTVLVATGTVVLQIFGG